MASTKKTSFWVHVLYCLLAAFVVLFVSGIVIGPERVGEVLAMIGNMIGGAVVAVIVGIVIVVALIWALLQL